MSIILVVHETANPALDAMIAGEISAVQNATFKTLVSGGGGHARFDCNIHVLSHGELSPNGVLWAERASNKAVGAAVDRGAIVRQPDECVVVPINPYLPVQAEARERIARTAARAGRKLEVLIVTENEAQFEVRREGEDEVLYRWVRDVYGRPVAFGQGEAPSASRLLRIAFVGDESCMRDVYPANLAALGDAADALNLALDIRFIDPRTTPDAAWEQLLSDVDGLLLPGGSDMEQVAGQIEAARIAIRRDLPTVGLCLGMQTMATAVAQEICGFNDANLAEADPDAQTKTFVRLHDEYGRPEFRLGLRRCRVVPGTRLSALIGGATDMNVHCNHRFVLDPVVEKQLSNGGMIVSGWQAERDLADAIEVPSLRFFIGMQGHPELSSRSSAPHPLLVGFLTAASEA